ncbi:MAG: bifunctional oligoribonuclease/PAP phosphatase NrnA [Flavobacteriaceae bacterium]
MNKTDVATVKKMLSEPRKIAIVPHKNPDGDAIGSTLALCHYLLKKGHEASVVAPNDYPKFLKWMPGNDRILNFERENKQSVTLLKNADIIFTLDFNHLSRVGQMREIMEALEVDFVMIDHHQSPDDYAKVTYSDTDMSSTCEMVYNFIEQLGDAHLIDPDTANCLYAGIMTDTGSFKFSSTTDRTHEVVAQLIKKGADNARVHQYVFDTNSANRMQLLGRALENLRVLPEYRTAYITLSQDELDQHHFQKGDTEGFVNYGLSIEGIVFATIFIENKEEGIIKISFRSLGDFSVNAFARAHFNGGGHTNAAGGRSEKSLSGTIEMFKSLLPQYASELVP